MVNKHSISSEKFLELELRRNMDRNAAGDPRVLQAIQKKQNEEAKRQRLENYKKEKQEESKNVYNQSNGSYNCLLDSQCSI